MKLELVATCLFGLEKLLGEEIEALGLKGAELYKHPLGIAEKYIGKGNGLLVAEEGNSSVYRGYSLITQGLDLFTEKMLKTEKTGCNKFKFHIFLRKK
jgi:hypothetical protein